MLDRLLNLFRSEDRKAGANASLSGTEAYTTPDTIISDFIDQLASRMRTNYGSFTGQNLAESELKQTHTYNVAARKRAAQEGIELAPEEMQREYAKSEIFLRQPISVPYPADNREFTGNGASYSLKRSELSSLFVSPCYVTNADDIVFDNIKFQLGLLNISLSYDDGGNSDVRAPLIHYEAPLFELLNDDIKRRMETAIHLGSHDYAHWAQQTDLLASSHYSDGTTGLQIQYADLSNTSYKGSEIRAINGEVWSAQYHASNIQAIRDNQAERRALSDIPPVVTFRANLISALQEWAEENRDALTAAGYAPSDVPSAMTKLADKFLARGFPTLDWEGYTGVDIVAQSGPFEQMVKERVATQAQFALKEKNADGNIVTVSDIGFLKELEYAARDGDAFDIMSQPANIMKRCVEKELLSPDIVLPVQEYYEKIVASRRINIAQGDIPLDLLSHYLGSVKKAFNELVTSHDIPGHMPQHGDSDLSYNLYISHYVLSEAISNIESLIDAHHSPTGEITP